MGLARGNHNSDTERAVMDARKQIQLVCGLMGAAGVVQLVLASLAGHDWPVYTALGVIFLLAAAVFNHVGTRALR